MNFPFVRLFFIVSWYQPCGPDIIQILCLQRHFKDCRATFFISGLGESVPFCHQSGACSLVAGRFLVIRKHYWLVYVQSVLTGDLGILMQPFLSFYLGWFWLQVTENPNVTGLKHKRKLILFHTRYPVLSWQHQGLWFFLLYLSALRAQHIALSLAGILEDPNAATVSSLTYHILIE